jgi:Na+-translocating ferredoxin:NAD+ oxidoreductase subunit D
MREERKFAVSDPPHLSSGETVPRAMLDVVLALVPITLVAIYFYRLNAVFVIAVSIAACALTDVIARRIKGRKPTLNDWSVVVTGLLLALCFSPLTNWWTLVFASVLAVGDREGVDGRSRLEPLQPGSLRARGRHHPGARYRVPEPAVRRPGVCRSRCPRGRGRRFRCDALALMPHGLMEHPTLAASARESGRRRSRRVLCAGACCSAGAYLLYRQHITWHIPIAILGTVAVFTAIIGHNPVDHLLTGGLMLGALFMATDWVTSPITNPGRLIFGVGIGLFVVVFRVFLGPTEGVAFAILIMNAFVPLIDRVTRRGVFGRVNAIKAAAAKATATKAA